MKYTPRMKQLLQLLLREDSVVSIKYLAEQMGLSKRTIQRELEGMDYALKDYGIEFRSRTGTGVWLEGSTEEKERLLEDTEDIDYDAGNREERRKRLILEILKEKGLKKMFYYSSQFKVSEATVSADLEAIEGWLNRYGLFVNRKPGSGISVSGSEECYRRAIRAFINENIDTEMIRDAYENTEPVNPRNEKRREDDIRYILDERIMKRVADCIAGMDNTRVLTLTENSYLGLVIHITIAVNRILKSEVIEPDEQWLKNIREDEDYRLAREIVRELEEEFEIQIPPVEISYICLHIKGAKHEKIEWNGQIPEGMENRKLQQLVNAMIDTFDSKKAYLLKQDEEFIQGLLAHLQPTMIRLVHGMHIQNPVLQDIQNSYAELYARCGYAAKVLEEYIGKEVPPEEIGFLTVHFGAALVRLEEQREKLRMVRVGVICSSGIGISRLMCSKLSKAFHSRIQLTAYGKKDITPSVIGRTDFFVSSISMEALEIPVISVNPLLNEQDMENIRQMISQYERMPEKYRETEEKSPAKAQIQVLLDHMQYFRVDERISFEQLLSVIGEKMSSRPDCQELIREDIRKREQAGSQIFAEFGFALLHTRTKGVTVPSFGICMTEHLGAFADRYFKGVTVIFIMLIPIDENLRGNSEIMGHISTMLIEDFEFMEVVAGGDQEKIRSALFENLKKYENKKM